MEKEIANYCEDTEDIRVEVWPCYVPEKSDPEKNYFFFAYTVKITNLGQGKLRLLRRHWIIRNGKGREEHIQGDGVVGEKPILLQGENFRYTSFCPLETPTGNMRGKYEFCDDHGHSFWVKIPLFFFRGPKMELVH
jgi:ApaG protein